MGFLQDYVGYESPPDYETQVNTIIDFWSNPCDAPWHVYLRTLWPVLGQLFIILVDTDELDLLRAYLRPRQGLTRGANRKKGRRRGLNRGIPDTPELIAKYLPGREAIAGRNVGGNEQFLWTIDGVIQRGLWYWLVVDLTIQGFYLWGTAIREEGYCNPVNRPRLYATDPSPLCAYLFGNFTIAGNFIPAWADFGYDITGSSVTIPAGGHILRYWAEFTGEWSPEGQITIRARWHDGEAQQSEVIDKGQTTSLGLTVQVMGPAVVTFEQRWLATPGCQGANGVISVSSMRAP